MITYENLYDEAVKNCPDIKMILEEKTEELLSEKTDKREIPIYLIRLLLTKAGIIVLATAPVSVPPTHPSTGSTISPYI